MVEITNCKDPCFALKADGSCDITVGKVDCPCLFYKPKDCEDWVRSERKDGTWLIPPEEYYEV